MRKKLAPNTPHKNIKGESNKNREPFKLLSPDGNVYAVKSIVDFIKNNKNLFEKEDLEIKRSGGKKYTEAASRLSSLKNRHLKSWKGWRLAE